MAKPVILTVDDDPDVLRAVERDLRQRYDDRYRVLRAESGIAALDLLRRLQQRNDSVALLLVDHRMPEMNGIETLVEAMKLYPDAKRVLLTAYADTEAAIKSINSVQLNHYLLKPWDPPDQQLYPVLDDLLDDWYANFRPPFEGVRVLGTRWSAKSYDVRNFLARNQVPYQWLDADTADREPEVKRLLESLKDEELKLPTVFFADGNRLPEPNPQQIAEKLGLRTRAGLEFYDLAILGGGPAGLAAAVYGASEGLKTVMVEREAPGGQAGLSSRIENYLGFPSGLSGADLARRAVAQARRFGVEIVSPQEATEVRVDGPYRYAACHGRAVEKARCARHGPFAGCRRLLRRRDHRGDFVPRRGRLHRWRRQLGRPGRDVLLQIRATRSDAGARRFAGCHHVAVSDRSN
jgi:thioredoxin reductase (NADPH)